MSFVNSLCLFITHCHGHLAYSAVVAPATSFSVKCFDEQRKVAYTRLQIFLSIYDKNLSDR